MGCKFKNILLTSILAVAGIFGVSSGIINTNNYSKANADDTVSTAIIDLQLVDSDGKTNDKSNMWIHCWDITVDSTYSIFNSIADVYNAGLMREYGLTYDAEGDFYYLDFESKSYADWYGDPDGAGSYGTQNYRSYHFTFPWYITGFNYNPRVQNSGAGNSKGVWARTGLVKVFWTNSGWTLDDGDKATWSPTTNVSYHTMTFDTNGGSSIADSPYKIKQYQKTLQPSNPTKFAATFSKWTLDNYSSADAFTFGEELEEDITLYAQWTYNLSSNIIMWKPANNDYIEFKSSHSWNKSGNDSIDVEEISYSSISIKDDTYYYVNPTNSPGWVVFHKTGSWGAGNQTADLPIPPGGLSGQYYYDLGGTNSWQRISFTITYKDEGGGDPTAENMASLKTTHYYGSNTELVSGAKAGHSFDGWFTNSDCEGEPVESLNGYEYRVDNIVLYAKWTCGEDAAMEFVNAFNDDVGAKCVNHDSNTIETYKTNWNSTHESNYNAIKGSDYITYWLDSSHGSTQANREAVALMLSRYEYILKKYGYGDSKLHDFMGKDPGTLGAIRDFSPLSLFGEEDNLSTVIIIVASSVALLSVTALSILVIKKRKNKEE